ncbi:MAG: hypothetical protein OEZ25_07595 [Candidatus Bathyarchaeota archaeon]|nr:hypothetical protein [Candidatus Bathyarchaeota archaeon]
MNDINKSNSHIFIEPSQTAIFKAATKIFKTSSTPSNSFIISRAFVVVDPLPLSTTTLKHPLFPRALDYHF